MIPRAATLPFSPQISHGQAPLPALKARMHLEQGQIWKQGGEYLRIVTWERLAIEYKATKDPDSKEGALHRVTKKEFCRLIKGAALHQAEVPKPPADS